MSTVRFVQYLQQVLLQMELVLAARKMENGDSNFHSYKLEASKTVVLQCQP